MNILFSVFKNKMGPKRVRKPKETIQEAIDMITEGKMSIRESAREYNIAKSMLARLVTKAFARILKRLQEKLQIEEGKGDPVE